MTRVDQVQFQAANSKAESADARSRALKDAREKAEQVAVEAGMKLGGPIGIEELDYYGAPIRYAEAVPGQNRIGASLRVTWVVER